VIASVVVGGGCGGDDIVAGVGVGLDAVITAGAEGASLFPQNQPIVRR
jgi:hypothetical protein